jgi:ubiquinone/menaquinone biosynthesis C-methylase UbiE
MVVLATSNAQERPTMATHTTWGSGANAEAIAAWDGPLFDRFLRYRHILTTGLAIHGEEALRLLPPAPGERVLDVGCGFGDATQRLAELVGHAGEAVGVDAAANFIEVAEKEQAGVANARFLCGDVQTMALGGPFDMAFSRFGTMFFANPVAALSNVREALAPHGRLVMVVWRDRTANPWLYRAQQIVEQFVARPEEYDEPTCGPGPFSMAGADTTSDVLLHAGFTDIAFRRCDKPIVVGRDVEEAVDVVTSLGPAGEILRLAGDDAAHLHDEIHAALREGLGEYAGRFGVRAPASTWIVSAAVA